MVTHLCTHQTRRCLTYVIVRKQLFQAVGDLFSKSPYPFQFLAKLFCHLIVIRVRFYVRKMGPRFSQKYSAIFIRWFEPSIPYEMFRSSKRLLTIMGHHKLLSFVLVTSLAILCSGIYLDIFDKQVYSPLHPGTPALIKSCGFQISPKPSSQEFQLGLF